MNEALQRLQRNFRKIQRVEVIRGAQVRGPEGTCTADWVQVFYVTNMGNVGIAEGLLSQPDERLAWLLEQAKKARKL